MNSSTKIAVCFVADFKYLFKNFNRIYRELRGTGNYQGEILVITSFLAPTFLIKKLRRKNKVTVFRFKKIKFDKTTERSLRNLKVQNNRHSKKKFSMVQTLLI